MKAIYKKDIKAMIKKFELDEFEARELEIISELINEEEYEKVYIQKTEKEELISEIQKQYNNICELVNQIDINIDDILNENIRKINSRYNEKGEKIVKQLNGFLARLVQHECDHLDGIVFLERVKEKNGFATVDNINKYNYCTSHHIFKQSTSSNT